MTVTQAPVLLEAAHVGKSFGGVRAVADLDWVVRTGEIWGVVGPNGSGKTTFFNCLSGFHQLSRGSVQFRRRDVTRLPMRQRARLGLVRTFQHAEVFRTLTVAENLAVAGRGRRADESGTRFGAAELLDAVGLGDLADVPAGLLSFGKRRQLGVAVAAATAPSMLLLDEPTSGLNDVEAGELLEHLRALNERGLTIAVVDHHMEFLLPLCHKVLLLRSGEKAWEGAPDEFVRDPHVVATYLGTGPTVSVAENSV
jgi:ABC-type branched-subunit amino acid transport system ATPase component